MRSDLLCSKKLLSHLKLPSYGITRLLAHPIKQAEILSTKSDTSYQIMQRLADQEQVRHSLFLGGSIRSAIDLYEGGAKLAMVACNEIRKILDPIDISFLIALNIFYLPILKMLHRVFNTFLPQSLKKDYEESSIFGHQYLEKPVRWHVRYFLPSLYALDILNVLCSALNLTKANVSNVFTAAKTVFEAVIIGLYLISIKDYLIVNFVRPSLSLVGVKVRDKAREETINELSTLLIWIIIAYVNLESLSKTFGFGLSSVFALGGIGSASIILALRSTFENFSGGVLVKLQDKFRIGDYITVRQSDAYEGTVMHINYLTTYIRRADDSIITIPNHVFTSGELVNWSRASYKRFQTTTNIPVSQVTELPTIINAIRDGLANMSQVESVKRDLVVAATSFDGGKITIKIDAYFNVNNIMESSAAQTEAISIIARATHTKDP